MYTLPITFFLTFLISCTNVNPQKKHLAQETWKGRTTKELRDHPYFKQLKLTKIKHEETETWVFRDQSRFQTDAYCDSLGGCIGLPIYNCDNIFSVKQDIILGFEQKGSCPGSRAIEAPKKSKESN